ncbi:MAG: hypothetical protein ABUS79_10170, partial [Pseudomonadota bacterium]
GPGLAQKWQRLRQRVKDEPVPARDPRGPCDSSGNEPAAAAGGAGAATPVEIFGLRPPLD